MGRFCVFCGIVNGEVETQKILESKNFFVILDNNPKAEKMSWHIYIQKAKELTDEGTE